MARRVIVLGHEGMCCFVSEEPVVVTVRGSPMPLAGEPGAQMFSAGPTTLEFDSTVACQRLLREPERLAAAVLAGDHAAVPALVEALDRWPWPAPREGTQSVVSDHLPTARVTVEGPRGTRSFLAGSGRVDRHGSDRAADPDTVRVEFRELASEGLPTDPAVLLALAVIRGDAEAALPLADEVQLGWAERARARRGAVRVADAGLAARARNLLLAHGIDTLDGLAGRTAKELLAIRGFGPAALYQVRRALKAHGMGLKGES